MTIDLFDANCTAALTTAVLLRIVDGLRASIPRNSTTAVIANKPPLWRGEGFAVLRSIEGVGPAGDRLSSNTPP
ncbi:hypothetical protein [Haladaptatus litoreus]|uniref:hypothetical protein n=1 Tax=Haladaptatus litoreus TaxID=553468 RepID=UPI00158B45CD|nr:hypothetical protein [Haladaptatus litoreus]